MKTVDPAIIPVPLDQTSAFIVRDRGVVLIDAGNPGDEGAILSAMREADIRPADLSLILLTHGHPDHYGSAAALRELTGAPVAVHAADAGIMRQGLRGLRFSTRVLWRLIGFAGGKAILPDPGGVEPDIAIRGPVDLEPFGVRGRVIPTPGHTAGSVSVLVSGGIAIIGDLLSALFPGGCPRLPLVMDDHAEARRSLRTLLTFRPERIYAAHGGPWSGKDVWQVSGRGWADRKNGG